MMRRMSKRFAARVASISAASSWPVGSVPTPPRNGWLSGRSDAMVRLASVSDEDDVHDHDQDDRAGAEQHRGAPPELVALVRALLGLCGSRLAPHEPLQ